jgi:hypothetical protein
MIIIVAVHGELEESTNPLGVIPIVVLKVERNIQTVVLIFSFYY